MGLPYLVNIDETRTAYKSTARFKTGMHEGRGFETLPEALQWARARVRQLRASRIDDAVRAFVAGKPEYIVDNILDVDWVAEVRLFCPKCKCNARGRACTLCRVPQPAGKQRRKWWSPGTLPIPYIGLESS